MTAIDQAFIKAYAEETTPPVRQGEGRFQPTFQVDGFAWPERATGLIVAAGSQVDRLADNLAAGARAGRNVAAIGGCRRGQGSTTLLLCAAKRLAERGLKVAMADADFENPTLARRLGVLAEAGWEEVFARRLPLTEVLIESIEEGLVLLPVAVSMSTWGKSPSDQTTLEIDLKTLREHHDLVLVDVGDVSGETGVGNRLLQASRQLFDSIVLVHDVRSTPQAELAQVTRRLQSAGVVGLDVVENFV